MTSPGGYRHGADSGVGGAFKRRFEDAFMANYGVPPVVLARGQGCRVWDVDGREYLDMIGGIAVSSLGHAHPALVEAVSAQVAKLAHTSNLFMHAPEVLLAERLRGLLGAPGRVFFANSGTEANECAYKIAVKYGKAEGRTYFVAAENGFHGRTIGALSLTGKASIRDQFGPFPIDVRFVPYGDADALKEAVTEECAAVFLEPTQGEAGVVPPPEGYFKAVREICDSTGALFVADEIQSAIGRTGHWFAHQNEGVLPDILTLAKGLGGGLPIGACIGFGRAGTVLEKGDHGSTFGGNPVACAAAMAVLDTIEREGLLEHARSVGARLADGIAAIDHPLLSGVRGRGLWLAALLTDAKAAEVQAAAQRAGFLVNAVQPDAVRLAPPLVINAAEVTSFVATFPAILAEVQA
ncbi:acetylornithine aminotransferase [Thermocatellispora tengchongensis]|uniref:Acetylornithine aminotransferase n=1 Tax=Thermocatellispora tengchongensis TaxID=1073253 RepID=A0A840PN05_9ACTN|nr:acetylornithine transaminase [Thermocatellispora tengchongensis]MBB5140276.1 acetylornithine aminotransferase [Thermocatellispora tengchongensis]